MNQLSKAYEMPVKAQSTPDVSLDPKKDNGIVSPATRGEKTNDTSIQSTEELNWPKAGDIDKLVENIPNSWIFEDEYDTRYRGRDEKRVRNRYEERCGNRHKDKSEDSNQPSLRASFQLYLSSA